MIVTAHKNKLEIKFKYDRILIDLVKTLAGREYNPARKSWFIPLENSEGSVKKLREYGFRIDERLEEALKRDKQEQEEAEAMAVMDDTDFVTPLALYPYQRVGAAFLYKVGSGILGDQPGCGKSVMALAVVERRKAEKVLIFCPAVLKHQWLSEIKKFLPHEQAVVIEGTASERIKKWRSNNKFYIANYELLLRDIDHIVSRNWDYVIADECTRLANPRAKQSKAIKKIPAKYRLAMSGTPITNRAEDVWNLLDFVQSGCAGNYWSFIQRYCVKNKFGGIFAYQNMDELKKKLKRYMIRRLKIDVLPELPEKVETDVPFVLSDEESELQKKIKKELLFEIDKMDISKINMPMNLSYTIAKFQRLRMLADSLELLGENKKSSKLEVLKELLEEYKDTDQQIILFSEFAEMCKILNREIPDSLMIIGDTSEKERQQVVKDFNDGLSKILIMSSAGMYGLNLQAASVVINYDLPFSLAKLEQRIGRAHRLGQKRSVQVYNLIGRGTADMAIKAIVHSKAELSGQLLGDRPLKVEDIKQMVMYEG